MRPIKVTRMTQNGHWVTDFDRTIGAAPRATMRSFGWAGDNVVLLRAALRDGTCRRLRSRWMGSGECRRRASHSQENRQSFCAGLSASTHRAHGHATIIARITFSGRSIMPAFRDRLQILSATIILLAATSTGAIAQKKYDTGATDTEIKIGNIMPYSGPASAYGVIGKTEAAYFKKINVEGGINGRKINFISYDDAYSPPK